MGIWDGLAKRFGYVPQDPYTLIPRAYPAKAAPLSDPPAFLRAEAAAEAYSIPDRSLPEAQLELYQRLSWVQIAVAAVADVGTAAAFNVKQISGEDTTDIPNHPFEMLLRRPNPLQSRAELLAGTLSYLLLCGNSFWWLNKVGPTVAELWLLPPHKVKPVPDGRMFLRGYIYQADETTSIPLELTEVVHFRRFHPLNSFVGLSPIEALAVVATGDMAAQKWNTNFFDKNNAKVPGILGFRDPIPDPDWDRMKRDIKEEYGGTKRSLMMMRGMGDGVQWISTAMGQGDMQFLEGRTFTKEEIFAIYAPGLSSMLAVNATEANSVSGKRTFIEYGVWPHLVRIAEKITNDLLPLYGPNLVGEFEDIRVTDKQMELSEISAYSQTHTVDEVRARYYQDEPLGDDRGNLLVTEVGKGLTPADPEAQELAKEAQRKALEDPQPDPAASQQQDAQDSEDAADENDPGDDMEDMQEDMPNGDMGQMQAEGRQQGQRQAEVKALRRWLRNRGDKADPLKFSLKYLSVNDALDIAQSVRAERARQEADGHTHKVQPLEPADIDIPHGTITPHSLKAMVLQLDPGDNEAEQRIRMALEKKSSKELGRVLSDMLETLYPDGWGGDWTKAEAEAIRVHNAFVKDQKLKDALSRALLDAVDLGVSVGVNQLENVGFGFDWTMAHINARDWAIAHTDDVLEQLAGVSEKGVGQIIARWLENGETLDALKQDLQILFGPARAERIAATEVTRAAAEGSEAAYKESGVVAEMEWSTAEDEKVCMICGGLNEKRRQFGEPFSVGIDKPPAHVNCRCWLRPVLKEWRP